MTKLDIKRTPLRTPMAGIPRGCAEGKIRVVPRLEHELSGKRNLQRELLPLRHWGWHRHRESSLPWLLNPTQRRPIAGTNRGHLELLFPALVVGMSKVFTNCKGKGC